MTRRERSHLSNPMLLVYCEGEASAEEIARVEAHIATCSRCRRWCKQVGVGVEAMRGLPLVPLGNQQAQIQANLEAAFTANVARWKERRVANRFHQGHFLDEEEKQAVDPTIVRQCLHLVRQCLNQSEEMRYRNRKAMLRWARMACWLAERCESSRPGGAATLFDLRALAWGQVGRALRVAGRLRASAAAFKRAIAYAARGSGDPPLRARLQRFEGTIALLDEVGAGWLQEAVLALVLRTSNVGEESEERLFSARARQQGLDDNPPEVSERELLGLHLLQQKARSLFKRGLLEEAEAHFSRARREFLDRDLTYEAATVSLDLIAVYVKLGLRRPTRGRIAEILPLFNSLHTGQEALASLIQLQQPNDQTHALNDDEIQSLQRLLKEEEAQEIARALSRELDAGPKLSPSAGEWDRSGGDGAGYDDDT